MAKSTIKKSLSVAFAGVMAAGLVAAPAMADDTTSGTTGNSIVLNGSSAGHTYEAYQLFTADIADGGAISNIKFGTGVDSAALLADADLKALVDADPNGFVTTGDSSTNALKSASTLARWLNKVEGYTNAGDEKDVNTSTIVKFNKIVAKHLTSTKLTAETGSGTTATFTGAAEGYYFIKDSDATSKTSDAATEFILRTIHKTTEINVKQSVPTLDKTVEEGGKFGKSATSQIGDVLNYKLTTTIPTNIKRFETYTYKIHDKMSKGLTFNKDVKVYTDADCTKALDAKYFTLQQTPDEGDTLTVSFDILGAVKDGAIAPGATLYTKYSATVNADSAVANDGTGNANTNDAVLQYSNNPNDSTGTDTTKTPEDKGGKVYDYVLKARVITEDADKNKLENMGYKLYNSDKTKSAVIKDGKITSWADGDGGTEIKTGNDGIFAFSGIDSNKDYYMKSVTTPDGISAPDYIKVNVNADSAIGSDGSSFDKSKVTGNLTWNPPGLAAETSSPMNWNDSFGGEEGTVTLGTSLASGLPNTGGMGTIMLYVAGGALILAAGYALYRRKKASDAE